MNRTSVEVRGEGVERLPDSLYEFLRRGDGRDVERYDGDGFDVVVVERARPRAVPNPRATVVVEIESEERGTVTVVAGGGEGLLGRVRGTGPKLAEELLAAIRVHCESLGLTVVGD